MHDNGPPELRRPGCVCAFEGSASRCDRFGARHMPSRPLERRAHSWSGPLESRAPSSAGGAPGSCLTVATRLTMSEPVPWKWSLAVAVAAAHGPFALMALYAL